MDYALVRGAGYFMIHWFLAIDNIVQLIHVHIIGSGGTLFWNSYRAASSASCFLGREIFRNRKFVDIQGGIPNARHVFPFTTPSGDDSEMDYADFQVNI